MNANAIDLAENLILTGYMNEAKKILSTILAEEPDNDRAICYMGIVFTETGENDKAIKTLDYYTARHKDTPEAWEALGCAWFKKGDLDKAEFFLRKAEKLSPESPSVLRNLGILMGLVHRNEDSHILISRSYELNPYDYRTLYALAFSLIKRNEKNRAASIIEEALFLDLPSGVRRELEGTFLMLQAGWL